MDIATRPIAGEKLYLWLVIFLGIGISIFVGFLMGSDALPTFIVLVVLVLSILWIAMARHRWWLLMPAAGAVGGYFYFGFKLYPHEVALLGCFVPLVISRAISAPGMIQRNRLSLPIAMYLLSAYLIAHWIGSNLYNRQQGEGGFGNVTRAYFNALWVILFLFAFRRYGSTKYMPAALAISYLASLARVAVTVTTSITKGFAYIPVINYILPGSTHSRIIDLRISCLSLATFAVCYFLIHKGFLRRSFHGVVFLGSFVGVLFGAGRGALVLVCLVPLFAAFIYRQMAPLILSTLAVGSIVFVLNVHPALLDDMPYPVQRSASILLLSKSEAAHYGLAESSDDWHERLREIGYQKWTQSWNTFLFGTGIRPFDSAMIEMIPGKSTLDDLLASSSKVGAYESGWWTVIAVTGLVGFIFYLSVLLYLLRGLVPRLLREKVRDHSHAFAFMGVFGIVIWLALGWANGGFPSTEIMFGFLALFALEDQKSKPMRQEASVLMTPALTRPRAPSFSRSR